LTRGGTAGTLTASKGRFFVRKIALVLLLVSVCVVVSCATKHKSEEDCPIFDDYQVYPADGGPDTTYEIFVLLKDDSENEGVEGIMAYLLTSDGTQTGKSFDLVRSDADTKRYLRAFLGSDLCDESVCNLFFQVIATHESGCIKGFDTDMFQVAYPNSASDDDTVSDDDGTDDTDAASDDTGDDTAG
jgi:hypothetical protein